MYHGFYFEDMWIRREVMPSSIRPNAVEKGGTFESSTKFNILGNNTPLSILALSSKYCEFLPSSFPTVRGSEL